MRICKKSIEEASIGEKKRRLKNGVNNCDDMLACYLPVRAPN